MLPHLLLRVYGAGREVGHDVELCGAGRHVEDTAQADALAGIGGEQRLPHAGHQVLLPRPRPGRHPQHPAPLPCRDEEVAQHRVAGLAGGELQRGIAPVLLSQM